MQANLRSYWSCSLVLTLSLVYLLVTLSLVTLSRLFLLCHVSGVVGTGTLAQYWSPFSMPDDQDILKWKFKGGVQKFLLNRLVDFSIKWVGGVPLVH